MIVSRGTGAENPVDVPPRRRERAVMFCPMIEVIPITFRASWDQVLSLNSVGHYFVNENKGFDSWFSPMQVE